ncbi:MAG: twin-arginine translocase TatA/TatE family subunit [Bacteroidales bacterium]|nr:twin-arginine translocase TatA/TatE family subunit [Bacteroidales bacterium]
MVLLFFDFGTGEIFLIVLAIFLVFGPKKIPELARTMGKVVNEIKKASEEVKSELNKEADRQEREDKLKKYREQVNIIESEGPVEEKKDEKVEVKEGKNPEGKTEENVEVKEPKTTETEENKPEPKQE